MEYQYELQGPPPPSLLYRLDRSITLTRAELGDKHPAVLVLTATYHNLLRKWAQL